MTLLLSATEATNPVARTEQGPTEVFEFDPNARIARVGTSTTKRFPPAIFDLPRVSTQALSQLDIPVEETTYLSIGGGLGSFSWVDHLVIHGADPSEIVSIGFEQHPHGRYKRLCHNSQIPDNERLRSDSGSTPDNIWGWPGYAVREIWQDLRRGKIGHAAYLAWQIFTEPVFAEPYTPKAEDVYRSIEREAKRIGWDKIWRFGRVRAIRQTDDGRYAIAYSQSNAHQRVHKIMITDYLHLAVGYSGFRFLPDLQAYREQTKDFKSVVNAYEDHNHVYEQLRRQGGTVIIRGRGIVASRIIQRLYEERLNNSNIAVLHLMRSPKPTGSHYERARRLTEHHFEHQPYNFPKACFGGDLRAFLAKLSEEERKEMIAVWGGTTTAKRHDWQTIIEAGLNEGWYQIRFGRVDQVKRDKNGKLLAVIQGQTLPQEESRLQADFIIDATGLDADLENNPLLRDLLSTYEIKKNTLERLRVSDSFELVNLRNGPGRVYASGAMTLGGPFAPVDSFVGLQYAAQLSVNALARQNAPKIQPLATMRSVKQWLRWARGVQP